MIAPLWLNVQRRYIRWKAEDCVPTCELCSRPVLDEPTRIEDDGRELRAVHMCTPVSVDEAILRTLKRKASIADHLGLT